jgi:hypothetical protein
MNVQNPIFEAGAKQTLESDAHCTVASSDLSIYAFTSCGKFFSSVLISKVASVASEFLLCKSKTTPAGSPGANSDKKLYNLQINLEINATVFTKFTPATNNNNWTNYLTDSYLVRYHIHQ